MDRVAIPKASTFLSQDGHTLDIEQREYEEGVVVVGKGYWAHDWDGGRVGCSGGDVGEGMWIANVMMVLFGQKYITLSLHTPQPTTTIS